MPHFNDSSALLFTRCVEAGIESPAELANIRDCLRSPGVFLNFFIGTS